MSSAGPQNEKKNELEIPSLKLTASLHLKMDDWKTIFLLGRPIFKGYVSFREGKCFFGRGKYHFLISVVCNCFFVDVTESLGSFWRHDMET